MTTKSTQKNNNEYLGSWLAELREDLKGIRKLSTDTYGEKNGENIKIRLESIQVEVKLAEILSSITLKQMDGIAKIASYITSEE